jgi:hypothetical protein
MAKRILTPYDFVALDASGAPAAGSGNDLRVYAGKMANQPRLFQRGPSGKAEPLGPSFGRSRMAWWNPRGDVATIDTFGMGVTTTGTLTLAAVNNTNFYKSQRRVDALVTTPSTTAVAGFRWNQSQWYRGDAAGRGGFLVCMRVGFTTGVASTTRGFFGFVSATGAPTDAEPSGQNNVLGFGWDAADSNISFMHKTGSGTVAKDTLSGSWARPAANEDAVYEATIYCAPNGSTVEYQLDNLTAGTTTSGSASSSLPANTTLLLPKMYHSVGGVSSVIGITLFNCYVESDT